MDIKKKARCVAHGVQITSGEHSEIRQASLYMQRHSKVYIGN